MNINKDCVECITYQIEKATKLLKLDKSLSKEIMDEVKNRALNFDFNRTPPYVAKEVYELLAKKIGKDDPP